MRPENQRMINFLKAHGLKARVKYLWAGSMKGCWVLYNSDLTWTTELREKLTALGFVDYDNAALHQYSGNGGLFSVCVRGHNELLHGPEEGISHRQHAAKVRPATECTAHHINFGGGCLNCGWTPPERKGA